MRAPELIAIACLLHNVYAKYKTHVTYTPKMVEVGDLDVFGATWTKIYAEPNNQNAVVIRETFTPHSDVCHFGGDKGDTTVTVDIDGQWGRDPGLGPHDAREAIVQAYWDFAKSIMSDYETPIWSDCWVYSPKGPNNPSWYPATPACTFTGCKGCPSSSTLRCLKGSVSHKVPEKIKITLTNAEGQLMADGLEVKFTANKAETSDGCNAFTKVSAALAGLIPGVGSLFSAGISVACELVD